MSDRNDAITVLKQARDILILQLSERILDNREEILDDARGESYLNDIDTLYEQVGGKLLQVNQMISNLPVDQQDLYDSQNHLEVDSDHSSTVNVISIDTIPEIEPTNDITYSTEPASSDLITNSEEQPAKKAPAFRKFLMEVEAGKITEAGNTLAPMFGLDEPQGQQCALHFAEQMKENPEIVAKAMNIRVQLTAGNFNDAMMLLHECFGLQGMESITVLQSLKAIL